MSKRGVSAIAGPSRARAGQPVTFTVTDWYAATPAHDRNAAAVTWELFRRRANGRYTSTGIRKTGTGTFTFGQRAIGAQYAVEGYLHEPELRAPVAIFLTVAGGEPTIQRLELLRTDGSAISGPLRYGQSIIARAHCTNMEGRRVMFRLYEDDVNGAGHDAQNERNAGATAIADAHSAAGSATTATGTYANTAGAYRPYHPAYATRTSATQPAGRSRASRAGGSARPAGAAGRE